MSTQASAAALGFNLRWAVFLSRLLWFTVCLSAQNCFQNPRPELQIGLASSPPTGGPPGQRPHGASPPGPPCVPIPRRIVRKHSVRSSVSISRNGTLGKTETALQTAVPKNSDCDFPEQTMEINCNPVKSKNGTGASQALEFGEPRLIYAKEIITNMYNIFKTKVTGLFIRTSPVITKNGKKI